MRSLLRTGFTLIELLVVIAIMGTLIGLLLSAVQQVRAAAQRTECISHLKQIGIALHSYHDNQRLLPPGMSLKIESGTFPYLSWNARILPYLEQTSLWEDIQTAYKVNPNFLRVPPHVRRSTAVRIFTCPSDPRSSAIVTLADGQVVAFTAYLGVEGTDQFKHDGMLFLDSRVGLLDVADGLSNTLLVGERPPSADNRFGWWYAGWGQDRTGSAEMVLGVREVMDCDEPCARGAYHFDSGSDNDVCDFLHFWSKHPGGAHFLFGDGSVRFVTYDADSIMPALATRSGGETVSIPD